MTYGHHSDTDIGRADETKRSTHAVRSTIRVDDDRDSEDDSMPEPMVIGNSMCSTFPSPGNSTRKFNMYYRGEQASAKVCR